MFSLRTIISCGVAAAVAVTALPTGVHADDADRADEVLVTSNTAEDVEPPHPGITVYSADARIDGQRVPEELFLAVGADDEFPHLASVWLLVDVETDEWAPICLGFLFGRGDRAVFVGSSTIGDEDEGCLILPLGDEHDDHGVALGVVELEGDSVATAAMYAID